MPTIRGKDLDGRELIKRAEKAGLRIEMGRGDHAKIYAPVGRGYQTVPLRPIGKGLACSIIKWLIAAGVSFGCLIFLMFN